MSQINFDAWSSGQIESKLWLCRELEKISIDKPQVIWVFGGWYGILGSLLLQRDRLPIDSIRSFDIDPKASEIADKLNKNWIVQNWRFKAFTLDVNKIIHTGSEFGKNPDIIINTSSEHFTSDAWFQNIPSGRKVVIQSNDMEHADHPRKLDSLDTMVRLFPLSKKLFSGELEFCYPTWKFKRFMLIGIK